MAADDDRALWTAGQDPASSRRSPAGPSPSCRPQRSSFRARPPRPVPTAGSATGPLPKATSSGACAISRQADGRSGAAPSSAGGERLAGAMVSGADLGTRRVRPIRLADREFVPAELKLVAEMLKQSAATGANRFKQRPRWFLPPQTALQRGASTSWRGSTPASAGPHRLGS